MKRDRFTAGEYLPLVAVMLLCVCVGSVSLPLGNTLTALWRGLWGRPLPEGVPKAILFSVRLPRVLCVALTGLTPLRHASALTLSGGELQRAFLAQVFAQDPACWCWTSPPTIWT